MRIVFQVGGEFSMDVTTAPLAEEGAKLTDQDEDQKKVRQVAWSGRDKLYDSYQILLLLISFIFSSKKHICHA
jgi:hypothetical protein